MNYKLCEYLPYTDEFMFRFDDGKWIGIDLVNNYPNYKIIDYNNTKIYCKVINILDYEFNKNISINDIKTFSIYDLKNCKTNFSKYRENNIIYKKATQTDYDKYIFKHNKKSDNSKLYSYLKSLYYNNPNPNNPSNNIHTTLII